MGTLEIISFIFGALGFLISIYFGLEARRLRNRNIRFDWADIQLGTRKLAKKVFREYTPDFIFASSGPSALVANLMMTEIDKYLPIYVGFSQKIDRNDLVLTNSYKLEITTTKWKTYLPNDLFLLNSKKVLIVEDCVITGDTLIELLKTFLAKGFKRENILIVSLIVNDFAINSNKSPDMYYYKVTDSSIFYMPWGPGLGKDY